MSFVVNQTKQHYQRVLIIELVVILLLALLVLMLKPQAVISFLAGMLSSYLPFCLLVYLVFFRYRPKHQAKMTALYRAEALKWLITIILIVASIKLLQPFNVLTFFAGYIVILIVNNLIPFLLSRAKIKG